MGISTSGALLVLAQFRPGEKAIKRQDVWSWFDDSDKFWIFFNQF
jgi:hypothetical protein